MKVFSKIIAAIAFSTILVSCGTTTTCPKKPSVGNIGGIFNTENDEYSPYYFDGYIYFTSTRKDKNKDETIFKVKVTDDKYGKLLIDTTLPAKKFKNAGLAIFFKNPATLKTEMYFAGIAKNSKRPNRDIYFSTLEADGWSEPVTIRQINSPAYESHPNISPDGKTLLFSSDREGGKGEIDLYVSRRELTGAWSKPESLGSDINTEKNEITPFIAEDGSLYYASQGYNKLGNYDIIKAEPTASGFWSVSRPLQYPINTDADETGPMLLRDKIYLSSNRKGGCGGRDLYALQLCGPVYVEGNVSAENPELPLRGKIVLYNEKKEEISRDNVGEDGYFKFAVMPMHEYIITYKSDCSPGSETERKFFAPCSDTTVVKIKAKFRIGGSNEYNLNEFKTPFFVSGYYMPNVRENLDALRLKFDYNMFGTSETTKYIENPGEKYDEYTEAVTASLEKATDFIYEMVSTLSYDCGNQNKDKIQIMVSGFADPRPIAEGAEFADADIHDEEFNMTIDRGAKMDNILLSKLRAYFTAKYFEKKLSEREKYNQIADKLQWVIEGKGVDASETESPEMKRRVNIKISFKEKDNIKPGEPAKTEEKSKDESPEESK